jgi:coproporphyrinogen III oxidase-like Fe-S oxidoreductase
MSKATQSFHPRVIIVDHFDEIVNQIDIKTETLLENQTLAEETRNKLNEIREKQIQKIDEIKELNLNSLPQKFNEEEYREKWSHVIDDNSLEYKSKIDRIKENLILFDFVLLENENQFNGSKFVDHFLVL